jgi:two-component system sensor histidine kinase MprB
LRLSLRVVLLTSLAVCAIALLLNVFTYVLVKHELYSRLDSTLRDRVALLSPEVRAELTSGRTLGVIAAPDEYIQVLAPNGATILPPYQVTKLPTGTRERAVALGRDSFTETSHIGDRRLRVVTAQVGKRYALQIARPIADEESALHRLRFALLMLSLAALLLSVLLGAWIAQTALSPVRRLTRTAEEVSETSNLSVRLDAEGEDEVARLGAAFNSMLSALEHSVGAQRQLVADASHEFRTPLTSIRANAELLARGKTTGEEHDAIARAVVDQVDELDGLVSDVIELALDGDAETRFEDLRLDTLVESEAARMQRHAPAIRFRLASTPSSVSGDVERLQRAIANILANAAKWSPPGGVVEVKVAGTAVSVRDHGPGIEEADLPFVFERFYRAPAARGMPGSGLGLAIVRHVAEAHGGSVVATNAPDGGAVLTLRLPPPND